MLRCYCSVQSSALSPCISSAGVLNSLFFSLLPPYEFTPSLAYQANCVKFFIMGLSNFPCPSEGVLPLLVMNTVLSVALLKNMFRSMLQVIFGANNSYYHYSPDIDDEQESTSQEKRRRVSITHYKSLCRRNRSITTECCCCVCLCGFEANQEVSELPCKHFFHKGCLEKWFHNKHNTCPLCRSIE